MSFVSQVLGLSKSQGRRYVALSGPGGAHTSVAVEAHDLAQYANSLVVYKVSFNALFVSVCVCVGGGVSCNDMANKLYAMYVAYVMVLSSGHIAPCNLSLIGCPHSPPNHFCFAPTIPTPYTRMSLCASSPGSLGLVRPPCST